ncbi:MAG: hypothetical protein ACK4XK_02370 [Casimicrobiaceae bacterium]
MLKLALAGVCDVVMVALPIPAAPPERHRLWPWAKPRRNLGSRWFCGLRHESPRLDEDMRRLLGLFDDQRTVSEVRQCRQLLGGPFQGPDSPAIRVPSAAERGVTDASSFDTVVRRLHHEGVLT